MRKQVPKLDSSITGLKGDETLSSGSFTLDDLVQFMTYVSSQFSKKD